MPRSAFWWIGRRDVEVLDDELDDGTTGILAATAETGDEDDERTFIAESGGSWERRLTRREKTIRGAVSAAVALAIVVVLLGGPGSVLASLASIAETVAPAPVAQAAGPFTSGVLDVPVPSITAVNPQISLSPVNGPNAAAYACWVDESPNQLGVHVAALHVALYAVDPHNWTLLAPPIAHAAGCTAVTDMTDANRVVLVLNRPAVGDASCALPDLFRSEDGGADWRALPWPVGALTPCTLHFELEGGRLYAQSDSRLVTSGAATLDGGQISVTSDGGATWRVADGDLAGLSRVSLVALRPGGRLLAQGIDATQQGSTVLWQSDDAGAHWRFLMTVPGTQPTVYAASDPDATTHGGWGRLYAYAGAASGSSLRGLPPTLGNAGAGATLATTFAEPRWTLTPLQPSGAAVPRWTVLSLAPNAASRFQRPAGAWQRSIAEGPSGSMLFTQPDAGNKPSNIVASSDLVVWNGSAWSKLALVVPANEAFQGASWDRGVMRLWVTHKTSVLRPVELFTFTLSPAEVR